MHKWKTSDTVKKVHDELYSPSVPDEVMSDAYITVIIKAVFASEKERTVANATWAQAVLEAIFDEKHLLTKIDVDIVDSWTKALSDTEMVCIVLELLYTSIFEIKILMLNTLFRMM